MSDGVTLRYGDGPTKYGPGVLIELSGEELAKAVLHWLDAKERYVFGPRTVTVCTLGGEPGLCGGASVYVDPSGFVMSDGNRWDGRGPNSGLTPPDPASEQRRTHPGTLNLWRLLPPMTHQDLLPIGTDDADLVWEVQIVHAPTNTHEVDRRFRTRREARSRSFVTNQRLRREGSSDEFYARVRRSAS